MLDTFRRYVEAGREALSPRKAEQLARSLVRQGQARRDQAGKLAGDLAEWSRRSSGRLLSTIRREVRRGIENAGVATKNDVEALKRRVRDLERSASRGGGRGASGGGRGASGGAKRTTAEKTTTAKKSTARRTARKSSGSQARGGPPATG